MQNLTSSVSLAAEFLISSSLCTHQHRSRICTGERRSSILIKGHLNTSCSSNSWVVLRIIVLDVLVLTKAMPVVAFLWLCISAFKRSLRLFSSCKCWSTAIEAADLTRSNSDASMDNSSCNKTIQMPTCQCPVTDATQHTPTISSSWQVQICAA
jgi:hypothetical protein